MALAHVERLRFIRRARDAPEPQTETRALTYHLPPKIAQKAVSVEAHLVCFAARKENAQYFGTWGLPGMQAKPMADVVSVVH